MARCPKCKNPMARTEYEGLPLRYCATCGGHWVDPNRVRGILNRRDERFTDESKSYFLALARDSDSVEPLICMRCMTGMRKERFRGWHDIVIDRCPKCQGIWFDPGELEKAQIFFEALRDGDDLELQKRIEALAGADVKLAMRKAELESLREELDAFGAAWAAGGRAGRSALAALLSLLGRF